MWIDLENHLEEFSKDNNIVSSSTVLFVQYIKEVQPEITRYARDFFNVKVEMKKRENEEKTLIELINETMSAVKGNYDEIILQQDCADKLGISLKEVQEELKKANNE